MLIGPETAERGQAIAETLGAPKNGIPAIRFAFQNYVARLAEIHFSTPMVFSWLRIDGGAEPRLVIVFFIASGNKLTRLSREANWSKIFVN